MDGMEITSLSSRGQVVIPQGIRDHLHLQEGEKFIVFGEDDTIVLKKLEVPSFKGFDKLLNKTRDFAKKKKLKHSDVEEAVNRIRAK
ncbi:MAG TPA: AbrB/MazE/SpoVT family DNA-binding domain-containing protein [Candidatus Nanoarchaeia archaeon]|nr:AbrB/MazE/SpoVT family DNA-binding domain-containing protein [Candidatus Nanoarchaeia archaeon]